jgi:hypothetical protein
LKKKDIDKADKRYKPRAMRFWAGIRGLKCEAMINRGVVLEKQFHKEFIT